MKKVIKDKILTILKDKLFYMEQLRLDYAYKYDIGKDHVALVNYHEAKTEEELLEECIEALNEISEEV